MKKQLLLFALLLLAAMLSACREEFLAEEAFDFATAENFYRNEEDATAALNAAYGAFQHERLYSRLFEGAADLPTEQVVNRLLRPDEFGIFQLFVWNEEDGAVGGIWRAHYEAIDACNRVINRVSEIDMNPDRRARFVAEARFLRALAYFNLVRFYGHVPLVTKGADRLGEAYVSNEGTAGAVWQLIIEDLKQAEEVLPESYESPNDRGRATRAAAKGILAKVYLQRSGLAQAAPEASWWGVEGVDEWQLAAQKAREVIDSGTYGLLEDYNDLWDLANEGNEETIFAINFTAGGIGEGQGLGNRTTTRGAVPVSFGFGTFRGDSIFFDTWDTTDLRFASTWLVEFVDEDGVRHNYYEDPEDEVWGGFPRFEKYRTQDALGGFDYGLDVPVLRYADLLLVYAEALNEMGRTAEAYASINQVRERAGLEPLAPGLSQEEMRQAIIQERVWELVMEGHGYFDYQRKGILEERAERGVSAEIIEVEPRHYLLPVPQRELDVNAQLVQHPAWR